jgi:ATP sulfurylase
MPSIPRIVKVLCTLGPSSLNRSTIERLEKRGVDLFRINLSHTPLSRVAETIEIIQSFSSVPVCLDTEGAQVRTGEMNEAVSVSETDHVRLTPEVGIGSAGTITLTPPSVFNELQPNQLVTLDFDGVMLLVLSAGPDGADSVVINSGKIGSNKAVVIVPAPTLPALSEKDREAVAIGRRLGVKHYALSFTNSADDVRQLRELTGPDAVIISKIESKQAVLNLDEILEAADEILIDRGDLSREVPLENIPLLQKAIIRKANQVKVPVNVATNLLESMIVNRKPTRAELNDIVNTLLDGANGLVLAAETAIGKYPVGAVDMVLNMIERFRRSSEGFRIEDLLEGGHSQLPALHGQKSLDAWPSRRRPTPPAIVERLAGIEIDAETALDVEQLAHGVYSPLRGFMTQDELESVLDNNRLPSGDVWTMPIVLQGKAQEFAAFQPGQSVRLIDTRTGRAVAVLQIEDKYEIDRDRVAQRWFGTVDKSHPGVHRLAARGLTFLGGPIEYLSPSAASRSPYELTPTQTRMIFDVKAWTKVVAFHTRNAPHRAHEHIIAQACERSHADGVLIHPAIGPQKAGDFSGDTILGAYEQLIKIAFPNALVASFANYSRVAGPREAVFNALCRKNFGCTHFVLGREHGDLDGFYPADASRALFESLGDIGITPVFFDTVYFSEEKGETIEGPSATGGLREISGARIGELLSSDQSVPNWCMRSELSQWLSNERTAGTSLIANGE